IPFVDALGLLAAVDQDYLLEARQMQALSLGVHIPLVCFGISFPAMVLFVEALYLRTGDPTYKAVAKRWSKVMIILFGIPIALAGIGGSMSVIAVNGWMNNPQGFTLTSTGEVTDVNPLSALFNANIWHEEVHMYMAGFIVASALVAGVYAVAWLKGRRDHYHRIGLIVPLAVLSLATPAQVVIGDWAARTVTKEQPTKLAAMEGLDRTTKGADLTLGGVYYDGKVHGGIQVPDGLSLLADHDPNATVQGLDAVPENDRPPVGWVRNAFQLMVGIGTLLAALGLWFLWFRWRRGALPATPWFYRAVVAAGPLALVALIAGWIVTEVGRQPWIVYEFMRTEEAVTG